MKFIFHQTYTTGNLDASEPINIPTNSQMCRWRVEGVAPFNIFKLQKSWSKVSQATKRVGHSTFCDHFFSNNLVTIVGQLIRTPPPLNRRCLGTSLGAVKHCLFSTTKTFQFTLNLVPCKIRTMKNHIFLDFSNIDD